MKTNLLLTFGILTALAATTIGCAIWDRTETHHANNLYNFLYAKEPNHVDTATIPVLSLPLRVRIAFVPPDSPDGQNGYSFTDDAALPENRKMDLMKQIGDQFKSYPFVKSIELVPTPYLQARGGFANLDQIRAIHGVDVVVLLSYDQVQFTGQGLLSLSYWTIVGAYVVEGQKNDTQTLLDGAVYDIASRKLLFRAPGLSKIKGSATPVNLTEQLRKDSERGYQAAATNLVAGLQIQLGEFRERVKNAPAEFKVVNKPGYAGASAFGGFEALLAGMIGAFYLCINRHRQ